VVVGKRRRSQRDEAGPSPSRGSAGACGGGGHGGVDRRDATRPVKGERVFEGEGEMGLFVSPVQQNY
jgi:hypothetical protein